MSKRKVERLGLSDEVLQSLKKAGIHTAQVK